MVEDKRMVMGDESFFTITGEEISRAILLQQKIDFFNEKYPDSYITDFCDGSVIRNVLESLSIDTFHIMRVDNDVDRCAFLSTASGNYLDLFGVELNAPRDIGTEAWGTVVFTLPEAVLDVIYIPADTILVSVVDGVQFATVADTYIEVGETSVTAPIRCVVNGSVGNVPADSITAFYDNKPYPSISVNNTDACTGGRDLETDDEYRARLLELKTRDNFGSIDYYLHLATDIDGVHDAIIIESQQEGYVGKVIVNGDNKPIGADTFNNVVFTFNSPSNLILNHKFEIAEVEYTIVDLEIEVTVSQEILETEFVQALTHLFNGLTGYYTGLDINQELSKYLIINCIESDIIGVYQITDMTSGGETFNRLTPDSNTVLKLGSVSVTQNIEE